jgi:hypothetical protein
LKVRNLVTPYVLFCRKYVLFTFLLTYQRGRGSKFCFAVLVVLVLADTLIKILHYCPSSPCFQQIAPFALHAALPGTLPSCLALQPSPAALPGSLARQPCPAALPGSLSRQPCPAVLPGCLARLSCPAVLPGCLARQPCPAAMPGSLARLSCPAALPGSFARQKYYKFNNAGFFTAVVQAFPAINKTF